MKRIVEFIKGLLSGETDARDAVAQAIVVFEDARTDLLGAAAALEAFAADQNLTIERLQAEVQDALDEAVRAATIASKLDDLLS